MTESEIKELKQWLEGMGGCNFDEYEQVNFSKAVAIVEENQQYHAIGTVEEFKALKEKAEGKKVIDKNENEYTVDFMCPSCNEPTIGQPYRPNYCKHCGCRLDWS